MPYLTATEIHGQLAAIRALAANQGFCTVTDLAATRLGTVSNYLHIHKSTAASPPVFLATGGVHGNEWVPPNALISFARNLLAAYAGNTDLTVGTLTVSKDDVKKIVDNIHIYIAPLINPDGYDLSRSWVANPPSADPDPQYVGRKNRRPGGPCAGELGFEGVDLNRQFDILWDYKKKYDASAVVASSTDQCDRTFIGVVPVADPPPPDTGPFSEPEARNVRTLLEKGVEYYVDCHMFGPDILYSWGIEDNQIIDPDRAFWNAAHDGLRDGPPVTLPGPPPQFDPNNVYMEFIPKDDLDEVKLIAGKMVQAVKSATSATYVVQQSVGLYATSGAADDYAYSRHFKTVPAVPKTYAFTLECGDENEGKFHPTIDVVDEQYPKIERELHAVLLGYLQHIVERRVQGGGGPPGPSTPGKKSWCCLLVVLAGTPLAPAVELLRGLRDVSFRETAFGRRFIGLVQRLYGAVSPPAAAFFLRHERLRRVVAATLFTPGVAWLRGAAAVAEHLPAPALRVGVLVAAVVLPAVFSLLAVAGAVMMIGIR